jgi:hypothetical protein
MKVFATLAAVLSSIATAICSDPAPAAAQPLIFKQTVQVDCPRLKKVGVKVPVTITVTDLTDITCDFDLTWISQNFPKIMRAVLPREGGSGGNRYHYSAFKLFAKPDGSARAAVHIKLDNFKYTKNPVHGLFGPRQIEQKVGSIEADVVAKIEPVFRSGIPDTVTSADVVNAKASGLIKLFNQAVPKNWFSLDREIRNASRDANAKARKPLLVFRPEPKFENIIADAIKRERIQPGEIDFCNSATGLGLRAHYRIVGGAPAFRELFAVYLEYNQAERK